jgi:hypothetical protein
MFPRATLSALVFLATSIPALAQESASPYEAATVVGDYATRFQQLGDINGDGYADAFSGYWFNDMYANLDVKAFINDGHGKLAKTWSYAVQVIPTSSNTWGFAAGDVNGDGLCDIAIAVGQRVYLLVTGAGGAAPTRKDWIVTGPNATSVALLDVDGDGILEIAALHGDLTILKYNSGSAQLTPVGNLVLGALGSGELRNADVDGRGQGDLIAWDAVHLWMIPMQGAQPQNPTTFLHGIGDPRGAAGDIDNDGDEDVVVFGFGQYVVFRRTGPTTYVQEPSASGGPARFLYDIDGDGFLDGVCCGGGSSPVHNDVASTFRIAMNDGTGHFGPALEMPGLGSVRLAGAADLDHDGDLDLVAGRCVFYAPAKILRDMPHPLPFTPRAHEFADLDGDKDLDLEPGTTSQRNFGDGTFADFASVIPAAPPGKTWSGPGFPGDFDGDGDMDVVVGQFDNGVFERMELLKNAGGGSFVDGGAAGAVGLDFTYTGGSLPRARDSIAADVDGDGDLDLVITRAPNASTKIFLNDGTGVFSAGPSWTDVLIRYVRDMNGDGLPDLIGYYQLSDGSFEITILIGAGGGSFNGNYFVTPTFTPQGGNDVFGIGDADGDGDLDIVATGISALYLFTNDGPPGGAPNFQAHFILDGAVNGIGSVPRGALFADADGDGQLDVIAWPVSWYTFDAPNASYIFLRRPDNGGYSPPSYQVMMPTGALDLDGDGDTDLVGTHVFKSRLHEGETGGMRKQSDAGSIAGLGGVTPTLGASGPFRVGQQASVVLTGGAGGVPGSWYQYYLGNPPPPFTGGHHPASASLYFPPAHFTTTGTPGTAGTGKWSLNFEVPSYVAGRTKVYHCDLADFGALNGTARSNKLYVTYGP